LKPVTYINATTSRFPRTQVDLSLIRGGPFYRAQQAVRVIQQGRWNHAKRVTVAIALTWLPLVAITALNNPTALTSLLRDYRVYARLLIGVPVLLIGQLMMDERFRMIVSHIGEAHLIGVQDWPRLDSIVAMVKRVRDSVFPEAAILVLVIIHTVMTSRTQIDATPWIASGVRPDLHLTPAGWYAVSVSATVFQFLLGLGLWKWLLWALFAFRFSRLDLQLIPTHPDRHGGLGFLGLAPIAFAPISFAASAAIGSTWRHDILVHGARLASFKLPALVLLILVALIALGPLAFFSPRLGALRRQGILDYGALGQIHSTGFHDKWIHHRTGHEAELLTAEEISTLCDYGGSYEKLKGMTPFPADRGAYVALAASVVVPMLPAVIAVVPLIVVVKDLLSAMR
jgi:hypothetical protein